MAHGDLILVYSGSIMVLRGFSVVILPTTGHFDDSSSYQLRICLRLFDTFCDP